MPEFIDRAQLHAKAGNGGAGAVSFRREPFVDKGGPDGGDGGDGGSVYLVTSPRLNSLAGFRDHPHRRAEDGGHGSGKKKKGARGSNTLVEVPIGTVVKSLDGELIADLASYEAKVCVARGGRGGKGNAGFLSNKRRAPDFAEQGELGEELWFDLELKLVADVALVGMPNVGKSSLVAAVSKARPKIGDYPFTTLVPSLGVVSRGLDRDRSELLVADVPGLIEGASEGRGLGLEFLRHVERSKVLGLVADASEGIGVSLEEQIHGVARELDAYLGDLSERTVILVLNKIDAADRGSLSNRMSNLSLGISLASITEVSAATREGIDSLITAMFQAKALSDDKGTFYAEEVVLRPLPEKEFQVERVGDGRFLVTGRDALRAVRLSDLSSFAAQSVLQRRLEALGVMKALKRLGVKEGDEVNVGDISFTYEDAMQP
jgi:GTP-binding protein